MRKKRPPIKQLREAGRVAQEMLVQRGLQAKDSIIDNILNTRDAPALPGVPAYLPRPWTIESAQRMFRDLLVIWISKCREKDVNQNSEDITEFWKFLVKEMRDQVTGINQEIVEMPRLLKQMKKVPFVKDIFSPMQKKETLKVMQRFFIDSFAIAIVLKNHSSVSAYANWFLDWTQQLNQLWTAPEKRKEIV